jgi:MoaA/NifB/PqqE/SkfB family radical SAM enzyme
MTLINATFVQIEPTTRCNFTCRFCAGRHMPQQNMRVERLEEILRAVRGLRHVELQGEGEPMLHPRFFEMAELIRRLHPQARISLITNGSLLNEENVERIIAIDFHKISVSIESPDPQAFAEIRGGKLEKVIEGIERLMGARKCSPHAPREELHHHAERDEHTHAAPSLRPSPVEGEGERRSGPAVGLAVTVLRRTMHELPRIVELYQESGLDGGITVQPLQTMPRYTQHYDAAMRDQVLTPIDRWHLAEQFQNHPRLREFFGRRPPVSGFYDELFAGWDARSGECPWLARGLYVAYNGQATGCCFIKNTSRDGFGELTPATAEQVAARREAMQTELREGRMPGPCQDCSVAQRIVASRRADETLPYSRM